MPNDTKPIQRLVLAPNDRDFSNGRTLPCGHVAGLTHPPETPLASAKSVLGSDRHMFRLLAPTRTRCWQRPVHQSGAASNNSAYFRQTPSNPRLRFKPVPDPSPLGRIPQQHAHILRNFHIHINPKTLPVQDFFSARLPMCLYRNTARVTSEILPSPHPDLAA